MADELLGWKNKKTCSKLVVVNEIDVSNTQWANYTQHKHLLASHYSPAQYSVRLPKCQLTKAGSVPCSSKSG